MMLFIIDETKLITINNFPYKFYFGISNFSKTLYKIYVREAVL